MNKTSSQVPLLGREPKSIDSISGDITTRLKGLDQLDWSIIHLYTLYFASLTTSFLHATMKHLYQMFRNYLIYFQALSDSVDTASPFGSDGGHHEPGTLLGRSVSQLSYPQISLAGLLLMSTYNLCFCGKISKII